MTTGDSIYYFVLTHNEKGEDGYYRAVPCVHQLWLNHTTYAGSQFVSLVHGTRDEAEAVASMMTNQMKMELYGD